MSRDLYIRDNTGRKFNEDILEISDELSLLVTQIEVFLFTRKREVLGSVDLGANLEDLLFSLNATGSEISSEISSQLSQFCPLTLKIPVEVQVNLFKGVDRDVGVIDIFIDNRRVISAVL